MLPDPQTGKGDKLASALDQFLSSMMMDYEKWHDGIGYDLSAIDRMTPDERESVTKLLLGRQPPTWRDLEALSYINSPEARQAVSAALKHPLTEIRVAAALYAENADDDREAVLIDALEHAGVYGGLTQALDQIEQFHPPAIIDALLRCSLAREGEVAVHFAAMLFFLFGKAKSSFDWDHRPFFLRFHTEDKAERTTVFKELCQAIGVNPDRYLQQ